MNIAIIGFGEVGHILAQDLADHRLKVYDILFADPRSWPVVSAKALGVPVATDAAAAVRGSELVISAVTAGNALAAARAAAPGLAAGAWFLDLNSVSPGTKTAAAHVIEQAGGRFIEAAVMSPFPPRRLSSPMLLGGPHAPDFLGLAREIGFEGAGVFSDTVGGASATKMCRSMMIKGVEALVTESLLTARHYGVEDVVLDSLSDLLPVGDWEALADYMIARSLEHGARRAEEMAEAARTAEEAGVEPVMSRAIARRQSWAGARHGALAVKPMSKRLDAIRQDARP